MDYYFIAYVFLSIVIGLTTVSKLFQSTRVWAAILCLVLFGLIFYFYGQRWFQGTGRVGIYTGSWPPLINMCPDYLVYFKNGNKDTCIDLIGVNRSGGLLKPWTQDDTPSNPPADASKYFNYIHRADDKEDDMKKLCTLAQQAGLTWEGITNGESCTFTSTSVLGPNAGSENVQKCK